MPSFLASTGRQRYHYIKKMQITLNSLFIPFIQIKQNSQKNKYFKTGFLKYSNGFERYFQKSKLDQNCWFCYNFLFPYYSHNKELLWNSFCAHTQAPVLLREFTGIVVDPLSRPFWRGYSCALILTVCETSAGFCLIFRNYFCSGNTFVFHHGSSVDAVDLYSGCRSMWVRD